MNTFLVLIAIVIVVGWLLFRRRDGDGGEQPADSVDNDPFEADLPTSVDIDDVEASAPPFLRGRTYSRLEIRDIVGGGLQDYLPHVGGKVVCGCFNAELNPDAPDVILPGRGPQIEKWAEVFAAQASAVPCFLKRGTNAWEYVGDYRVATLSRAAEEIEPHALGAGRNDVSMVLFLDEQ